MTHAWGLAPTSAFNHPSWSISAEWAAYLGFPAFAFVAWRLRDRPVLATGLAAGLALALYAAFEFLAGYALTLADGGHELVFSFDGQREHTGIPELLRDLAANGIDFKDLKSSESSLEEIFVNLLRARA